jgi:hypothetical protein
MAILSHSAHVSPKKSKFQFKKKKLIFTKTPKLGQKTPKIAHFFPISNRKNAIHSINSIKITPTRTSIRWEWRSCPTVRTSPRPTAAAGTAPRQSGG